MAATALDDVQAEGDARTGMQILRRALEEPLRGIAANAGMDGAVVAAEVRRRQEREGNPNVAYDVLADDYGDMLAKGIVDPAKVTRAAVENAASIAALLLATEALIADKPEQEQAPAMPGGMGDMDY